LTEPDPMFHEMIRAHNNLSITAVKTSNKFDDRMRATVKELLGYRYALEGEPIEVARERRALLWHLENADRFSDALFGVDSSKKRQFMKDNYEWNRTRPLRIYNYVQKLTDIFPSEHLTRLLSSSLTHTPEEIISLYEANKGEAKQSDYSSQPTAIDPRAFKTSQNSYAKFE